MLDGMCSSWVGPLVVAVLLPILAPGVSATQNYSDLATVESEVQAVFDRSDLRCLAESAPYGARVHLLPNHVVGTVPCTDCYSGITCGKQIRCCKHEATATRVANAAFTEALLGPCCRVEASETGCQMDIVLFTELMADETVRILPVERSMNTVWREGETKSLQMLQTACLLCHAQRVDSVSDPYLDPHPRIVCQEFAGSLVMTTA